MFGGASKQTFIFNMSDYQQASGKATVRTHSSTLTSRARYGHQSDWVGRAFGNFLYMIDACENNLNVFDINGNGWTSFNFSQLKLPVA